MFLPLISVHLSSLQTCLQPETPSSPSAPHFDPPSLKGNGEGGCAEDIAEVTKRTDEEESEGGRGREESAGAGDGGQSAPVAQTLGGVRTAPTMVTNVVRPIVSTPIPIASKPAEGAITLSSLPQEKATLLIGGGGAAGGGYLSSSSPPGPIGVTSLVLGGSFPATQTLQLITPHPQTHPPILHPTATSSLPHQVQYVLPTDSPSSPQLTHQHVLPLPPNGVQPGAGVRASPGTRGETGSDDQLTRRSSLVSLTYFTTLDFI